MVSPFAKSLRRLFGPRRPVRPRVAPRRSVLRLEDLETRLNPGVWTQLAASAQSPGGAGTMMLLSDGSVMIQGGGVTNSWYKLSPDSAGNYVNGTVSTLPSMSLSSTAPWTKLRPSCVVPSAWRCCRPSPTGTAGTRRAIRLAKLGDRRSRQNPRDLFR